MEENKDLFDSTIDNDTAQEMYSAAKWSRSFAVLIFAICGIALLLLLAMGNILQELVAEGMIPGAGNDINSALLIVVVVGVVFVFITTFFLFRSANSIRTGLKQKNQALFNRGLSDLKIYFTIFGVLSILSLLGNLIKLV